MVNIHNIYYNNTHKYTNNPPDRGILSNTLSQSLKPRIVLNRTSKFYSATAISLICEVVTNRQVATIVNLLERKITHMLCRMVLEFSSSYSE